jgi:NitT/TauT family transport system substrate-binding protein
MEELRPHLEKFFRIWAMATRSAKIDPETVAKMCKSSAPEEWENPEAGQALMDAAIFLNYSTTEKLGDVQPEVWKKVQGPYLKFKQIDAELDPATFLDNSFIEPANNFTDDEIKADLDAWKTAHP